MACFDSEVFTTKLVNTVGSQRLIVTNSPPNFGMIETNPKPQKNIIRHWGEELNQPPHRFSQKKVGC